MVASASTRSTSRMAGQIRTDTGRRMELTSWQKELDTLRTKEGETAAWDDVSGAPLDPALVAEARRVEMKDFQDMSVCTHVPRSDQLKTKGKIIKVGWVDINKGDSSCPNYRSRPVGKEYKTEADNALYSSTPPLEALRCLISIAATENPKTGRHRNNMLNDISRAYV